MFTDRKIGQRALWWNRNLVSSKPCYKKQLSKGDKYWVDFERTAGINHARVKLGLGRCSKG